MSIPKIKIESLDNNVLLIDSEKNSVLNIIAKSDFRVNIIDNNFKSVGLYLGDHISDSYRLSYEDALKDDNSPFSSYDEYINYLSKFVDNSVDSSPVGPSTSPTLANQEISNDYLLEIKDELVKSSEFSELLFIDKNTRVTYIKEVTLNETDGSQVVVWRGLSGAVATPSFSDLIPVGSEKDFETIQNDYTVLNNGTGYSVGDFITSIHLVDTVNNEVSVLWRNVTQSTTITPLISDLKNVKVGVSTLEKQIEILEKIDYGLVSNDCEVILKSSESQIAPIFQNTINGYLSIATITSDYNINVPTPLVSNNTKELVCKLNELNSVVDFLYVDEETIALKSNVINVKEITSVSWNSDGSGDIDPVYEEVEIPYLDKIESSLRFMKPVEKVNSTYMQRIDGVNGLLVGPTSFSFVWGSGAAGLVVFTNTQTSRSITLFPEDPMPTNSTDNSYTVLDNYSIDASGSKGLFLNSQQAELLPSSSLIQMRDDNPNDQKLAAAVYDFDLSSNDWSAADTPIQNEADFLAWLQIFGAYGATVQVDDFVFDGTRILANTSNETFPTTLPFYEFLSAQNLSLVNAFKVNPDATEFNFEANPDTVGSLDFSTMPLLESIGLANSSLDYINVSGLSNLTALDISGNNFTTVAMDLLINQLIANNVTNFELDTFSQKTGEQPSPAVVSAFESLPGNSISI